MVEASSRARLMADNCGCYQKSRKLVAIKSVHLQRLNKKLKDNLFLEIEILRELQHPHITALFDCQESTNSIHLIMEFCALGDLSSFVKKREQLKDHDVTASMISRYPNEIHGGLNDVIVRHFLKQLASALEFLRARDLIHRDIKPQNILLTPSAQHWEGRPVETVPYTPDDTSLVSVAGVPSLPMLKLADFGFARSLPATSLAETLCGSPLYMAPEILRYEKYDAKADLWSVGTVLYEMVCGKPPFRANNHVELLRKIEKGNDVIRFPEGLKLDPEMKLLVRALLKRNPVGRAGFPDFFNHPVIKRPIPGLVGQDRDALEKSESRSVKLEELQAIHERAVRAESGVSGSDDAQREVMKQNRAAVTSSQSKAVGAENRDGRKETTERPKPRNRPSQDTLQERAGRVKLSEVPRPSQDSRRLSVRDDTLSSSPKYRSPNTPVHPTRPPLASAATAPSRTELHSRSHGTTVQVSGEDRHKSSASASATSVLKRISAHGLSKIAEQDDCVAENDYVLVDKDQVQVNAFADQLGHSPLVARQHLGIRHNTAQVTPTSAHGTLTRELAIRGPRTLEPPPGFLNKPVDVATKTASAITNALNATSLRLFGTTFSPELLKSNGSPPRPYGAFPAFPNLGNSLIFIDPAGMSIQPVDMDAKLVFLIEESAHKSDVVYGYAEVKYKQIIPISMLDGLSVNRPSEVPKSVDHHDDLPPHGIITVSEEAIVLYIKTLGLLSKSFNAGVAWWARRKHGDAYDDLTTNHRRSLSPSSAKVVDRVQIVVEWVRTRFNECMDKLEYLRLKHALNRRKLPEWHPHHPSKELPISNPQDASHEDTALGVDANGSKASLGGAQSGKNWYSATGVTAEKLLQARSIEMSRNAAVHELVGEDLEHCEINYVTAIRMLEACIEPDFHSIHDLEMEPRAEDASDVQPNNHDDDPSQRPSVGNRTESGNACIEQKAYQNVDGFTVSEEYRKDIEALMESIRTRLASLRRKLGEKRMKEQEVQRLQLQHQASQSGSPQSSGPPMA